MYVSHGKAKMQIFAKGVAVSLCWRSQKTALTHDTLILMKIDDFF